MGAPVLFASLSMTLPDGWCDITESGKTDTLARGDGLGALQFSSARYRSGPRPDFTTRKLAEMLGGFGNGEYGRPANLREGRGTNLYAVGDFQWEGSFSRVWYVSNGSDIALVTYTVDARHLSAATRELQDAEALVESLGF